MITGNVSEKRKGTGFDAVSAVLVAALKGHCVRYRGLPLNPGPSAWSPLGL